jgi:hypothetical protein
MNPGSQGEIILIYIFDEVVKKYDQALSNTAK